MKQIACVFVGQKYPVDYVLRLYEGCRRNMPSEGWIFNVLTDYENYALLALKDFQVRLIEHEAIKGYWNKLALFKPDMFHNGDDVLYLDLDVLVHGSLERLFRLCGQTLNNQNRIEFAAMADPIYGHRLNSSVMAWRAGDSVPANIWKIWNTEGRPTTAILKDSKGDQAFIEWALIEQNVPRLVWPKDLVRGFYSRNPQGTDQAGLPWLQMEEPGEESVIVFHGRPRFHDKGLPKWVKEMWHGLS